MYSMPQCIHHGGNPSVLDDEQSPPLFNRYLKTQAQILYGLGQGGSKVGPHRLFGNPGRHGNGMPAAEGQEPRIPDDSGTDLDVELHPGPLPAAAGGPPMSARAAEHSGT